MRSVSMCVSLLAIAAGADAIPILSEGFDDISSLGGAGWATSNNSAPLGISGWFQGNDGVFSAHAGASDAYIAANFLNAGSPGNISNWLLTPMLSLADGDTLTFYTRTEGESQFPDRLEVRLSTSGASTDVGGTDASVGVFDVLLLSINASLSLGGYPEDWAVFSVTVSGLGGSTDGRFGFRYFVTDTENNANYIGIDTVQVERVPEPSLLSLFLLGAAGLLRTRMKTRMKKGAE
jgi:hypothetical protein